jgi:hypothetical protein
MTVNYYGKDGRLLTITRPTTIEKKSNLKNEKSNFQNKVTRNGLLSSGIHTDLLTHDSKSAQIIFPEIQLNKK